jgi:hypothetical protein
MNWLFKEERTHYGYDELVKDKKAVWNSITAPRRTSWTTWAENRSMPPRETGAVGTVAEIS